MGAWASLISLSAQIFLSIMKNIFERNAQEKKRKDDLHAEWKEVIASGDISRINAFVSKLR